MKYIFDFLKGIPIGIANVIPGFSGGTMAVILNIYERFINAFSDFFRHPLRTIKDVWALAIGLVVGVIIAILILTNLLQHFPIPTSMFFVGLIIGSIPDIEKQVHKEKIRTLDVIVFFVSILAVIILPFLGAAGKGNTSIEFDFTVINSLVVFVFSVIASATMVIPGVSGSMVLLALGQYNIIWVGILGSFIDAMLAPDLTLMVQTLPPVLIFASGVILGIVLISKLIRILLVKYPRTVYCAILGLLFASPFAILYGIYHDEALLPVISEANWITWTAGILMMAVGAIAVMMLSGIEGKHTHGSH